MNYIDNEYFDYKITFLLNLVCFRKYYAVDF